LAEPLFIFSGFIAALKRCATQNLIRVLSRPKAGSSLALAGFTGSEAARDDKFWGWKCLVCRRWWRGV